MDDATSALPQVPNRRPALLLSLQDGAGPAPGEGESITFQARPADTALSLTSRQVDSLRRM